MVLPRPAGALLRARACCTATSRAARCTACCACATSPRTTPTSSAREEQVQDEVSACLDFAFDTYKLFGIEPHLELSTRPEQRVGDDALWDRAEAALERALDEARPASSSLNEGDGAFYGPKIDLHMTDSLGRSWQLGTVQLDYSFPERFDLTYTGADNAEHRVVMIHRALMGSYERFIGILIEHLGGEFPLWLAPVQAIVLPISDRHAEAARGVAAAAARGRPAARGRRAHRVGRAQDPRRRAAQDPVHARRRRPRGRDRAASPCASTAGATPAIEPVAELRHAPFGTIRTTFRLTPAYTAAR